VSTGEARDLAIIAVIAVAPLAITLIFALLRGYNITVHPRKFVGCLGARQQRVDACRKPSRRSRHSWTS
jgi:hypothetical protein